ncbi:MAG: MBL fold metallo-hydrolase [Candidatus Bipolaricaulia bacterium]
MKLIAYSKGLYSTWVYYSPDRILLDAGEGVSPILGNKSFAIRHIFLSHGHADHISGLVGLINIRNNAMGDREKPLTIYYPRGNWRVSELMGYLWRTNRRLRYQLEWVPLGDGERIQVFRGQKDRYVEAFKTVHSQDEWSLGYNVIEVRERLKKEYRDLPQEEIIQIIRDGKRNELLEMYDKKLLSYGGDSIPLDPRKIEETDLLLHDVTFLREQDRKEYKHATVEEALQVAKEAHVQQELLAIHISSRYKSIIRETEEELRRLDLPFKVTLLPPGKIFARE